MDQEKRKTIIQEIESWRRSKLLPEHYCDFLLNLYLEGDSKKSNMFSAFSASSISNSTLKVWLYMALLIGTFLFCAINFSSFYIWAQIGVSALFVVSCYGIGYLRRNSAPIVSLASYGMGCLSFLLLGVLILKLNNVDSQAAFVGYVALSSLVWVATGIFGSQRIYHYCGWIGLAFSYGWLLNNQMDQAAWYTLQLSWLPLACLFVWLGWLIHYRDKKIAGVIFVFGCSIWFAPEVLQLLTDKTSMQEAVQLILFGKLIAAVGFLFSLRKKWIEWVV